MLGSTFEDCQVGAVESPGRFAQPWRLRLNREVVHNGKLCRKDWLSAKGKANSLTLFQYSISSIFHFSVPLLCFLKLINTLTILMECMV